MIDLGPYTSFILLSYGAAGLILGYLITSSLIARRAAEARLKRLEAMLDAAQTPSGDA